MWYYHVIRANKKPYGTELRICPNCSVDLPTPILTDDIPEYSNIYLNTWVLTLNKNVLFILENTQNSSLNILKRYKGNIPKMHIYYLFSSFEQVEEAF